MWMNSCRYGGGEVRGFRMFLQLPRLNYRGTGCKPVGYPLREEAFRLCWQAGHSHRHPSDKMDPTADRMVTFSCFSDSHRITRAYVPSFALLHVSPPANKQ